MKLTDAHRTVTLTVAMVVTVVGHGWGQRCNTPYHETGIVLSLEMTVGMSEEELRDGEAGTYVRCHRHMYICKHVRAYSSLAWHPWHPWHRTFGDPVSCSALGACGDLEEELCLVMLSSPPSGSGRLFSRLRLGLWWDLDFSLDSADYDCLVDLTHQADPCSR
jgi:hypothetical protein